MAPSRWAAWCVAAALLALVGGAAAQAPAAGCRLPLYLNASASTLSLAGSSVDKPVAFALTPAFPDAQVGLEGSLTLALPGGGPCPTDAAGLAAQLAGGTLQPSDTAGPLLLYPTTQIVLNGGTFVTLTLQGNKFNVSSSPLAAGGSGSGGSFSTDLTGLIVEGTVLSNSSFTGVETLSMVGINATNTSAAAVTTQGSTLTLSLPVYWVMRSVYQNAKVGEGVSLYHFSGQIVAQATFGCPADCGPNGRCTSTPEGAAACACECGWAGPACDVPSGFCSSFPAELSGSPVCPVAPAPAPAPPAEAPPCRPLQDCSTTQEFDAASATCTCRQGWSGPGTCSACQTGAACDALFGTSGSSCSSEVAFQQGMPFKAYTCDLAGTGLEETIEPGSFYMVCNTSASAGGQAPASSAEQYCKVNFALKGKGANPVTCKATECGFRANSTRVDCATTECACLTDCPDVQGILNTINGKPCSIDCDAAGNCKFDIQGFFVTLVAPCQTAACVVPGFTFVEGDYRITESQSYDPVIAAVPLMALVGLAGFLSLYLVRHRSLFASGRRGTAAAAAVLATANGAPAPRRRPIEPVHLLTFDDLSCAVRLRQRCGWLRRCFSCGRAAAAPAAQEAGVTAAVAVGGAADPPGFKQILKSASGVAANGELVGVLGPSGSGKTTLLAIVAGSAEDLDKRSVLTGSVLMDGQPILSAQRRKIAYVAQDDTLLPTLTVEECVRYSAVLRLQGAAAPEIQAAVHSVLAELGLSHVARSQVGGRSGIRGISGGERRRVTIAMELVTEPAVLVLDEPTSGLDSYTALNLMRTMKQVASGGRIVLLSFHQPSPAMFNLLDRAYLMAQGYCIFSGPPAAAESWFAQRGLPCPVGTAIAEHMLDSVSDPATLSQLLAAHSKQRAAAAAGYLNGSAGSSGEAHGAASELVPVSLAASSAFEESNGKLVGDSLSKSATPSLRGEALAVEAAQQAQQTQQAQRSKHSISRELAVVFWRTFIDIWRNPVLLALHWVLALLMGAFVGAVFFNVSFDVSGAQNRVGAMFFVLCFFAFTSLTTVDLFQMERKMVVREVRGGYYRPATYLLAKMVLDALLLRVIPVFIFAAPFYPMMGLQSGSAVVATFLFVVSTFAAAMGAMSLAVTVGSSSAGTASLIMNIVLLVGVVVSGMLVNPESMEPWIRWTHYISIFFYSYSAMMINEMSAIKIDFELQGYAAASNVRGTVFLETIGIDASDLTRDIIICDVFWAGLVALAFFILYVVMPRPRGLARKLPRSSPPSSK